MHEHSLTSEVLTCFKIKTICLKRAQLAASHCLPFLFKKSDCSCPARVLREGTQGLRSERTGKSGRSGTERHAMGKKENVWDDNYNRRETCCRFFAHFRGVFQSSLSARPLALFWASWQQISCLLHPSSLHRLLPLPPQPLPARLATGLPGRGPFPCQGSHR